VRAADGGDILCLVEAPAEYKVVTHQVVIKAEETREIEVPAVTELVEKKVIDQPARVIEHKIPAVERIVKVRRVIKPEVTETITIPATHKLVEKERVIEEGKVDWREILCDVNTTREVVVRIQTALYEQGYYKGPRNGVFGRSSIDAMVHFQHEKHLSEGQLTIETVKGLKIEM